MGSFEGYSAIAGVYDKLNKDIDYSRWADLFMKYIFRPAKARRTVSDFLRRRATHPLT